MEEEKNIEIEADMQDEVVEFKDGQQIKLDINLANKKRHFYVFGKPESGKSYPFKQLV